MEKSIYSDKLIFRLANEKKFILKYIYQNVIFKMHVLIFSYF